MRERLNVRFSAYVAISGVVLSLGWYFVHASQVTRTADALLEVARRAEKQGELYRAARLFSLYLDRRPTDVEALASYGQVLDKLSRTADERTQVIDIFEQVLVREPEKKDIRRRLALLALQNDDAATALTHFALLRQALPQDSEIAHLLGVCHSIKAHYQDAARLFRAAIRLAPTRTESYLALADLLRDRLDKPEQADEVMDSLVQANRQSFQVYLERARFKLKIVLLGGGGASERLRDQAEKDVAQALRLAPSNPDVLLLASRVALEAGRVQRARDYLKRGMEQHPTVVAFYEALAVLEIEAGRPGEALDGLRHGLTAIPENAELSLYLADLLIRRGQLPEAEEVIGQFAKLHDGDPRLGYLRARLRMARGQWLDAVSLLENAAPLLADAKQLNVQCQLSLGQCYARLGDVDRQLIAYRQAASLDPLQFPACLGIAAALAQKGRLDDSIGEYQKLMQLPQAPPLGWLLLARQMLLRNLSLPSSQRQRAWEQLEPILKKAEIAVPDSVDVVVLRAEILVDQQQFEEAQRLLEKARAKNPKKLEVCTALATVLAREGKWPAVEQALLDAERQIGDSAELRLTRLKLLLLRHDNQAAPFLSGLAEGLERFAKEDQARLLGELADAYVACGQVAEGVRLWKRVEVLQPDNLSVRIQLFNLAMQGGDEPGAEELEQAIRRIDRSGIYGNFCAACRCIQQAQAGEHEALVTARDQLVAIARQRPEWPHVQVCLARVAEMENNGESAIEYYRRALELGEHRPGVVRQLIELLFQRQRYAEAEDAINKLQERAPISSAVQKLAAEIALRGSNPDRALAWANKAVPANVKDYRDQIWLGQFLWAAGRKTEAEAALRRALALAEGNPDPWVALVQYQVRIGQLREAQATIQKAEARLPRDAGSLALAQCYEAVKRPDRAEECYRAAATAKPGDFGVLRMVADFYLRSNQFSKAEPCLRKFLDPQQHPPDSAARWARRMLAVRLAVAGTFPQFQEALGLLERNLDNKESVEDQLAKATVLATRPVYRRDAIALLESAFKQKPPAPDEEFLLAQLYDIYDHKLKAQEIMVRLLGAHPDNPVYLARFLGSQIRQSRFEECETWMKKLRALQPHAFATVELEARLLSLRGEGQGVIPLIKTYLENKNSDPGDLTARLQLAAELLEQLGQEFVELRKLYDPLTEDLYRKVAAKSGRPDAILALARCFARQHRLADALGLCERAWQSSSPETAAQISVAVLTSAAANESQLGRVEKWLAPAVAKKPRAVALLGAMAILRERQGRYADAEALYRQMIAEDSHAGAAFNNLAYLLSFQKGRGEEALDLIDRAMELQGPNPDCLDTRAVIYLALGREDKAIADLNEALADGSNATWYYHLAIAYIAAKNSSAATNALSQAKKLGLEVNMLHPLERSTCQTILDSVNRG